MKGPRSVSLSPPPKRCAEGTLFIPPVEIAHCEFEPTLLRKNQEKWIELSRETKVRFSTLTVRLLHGGTPCAPCAIQELRKEN